ncbi:nitrous oxide reductase accessory protein NosL [Pricia sp.]|uniref:nitrous oxide reductase accessory protein NosL n=1 Tax=Pricia sp. TaxID=2268138 RepID=UPI0035948CFA
MKNLILLLLIVPLAFTSCNIGPEPINYGSDACHYCSMTIVDKQHAAEFVTQRGKAFKFDSIECMMNSVKDTDSTEIALFLANGFDTPGKLIDGTKATYLISKNIPSPMGEFLSAFENREAAGLVQSEQNGALFSWQDLKERFEIQ